MIGSAGLGEIVAKLARVQSDAPALVDGDTEVRYSAAELDRRRRKLANALLGSGLAAGDRVAVVLSNGIVAAEVLYGIATAGLVQVNVNERLAPAEIVHILGDSGARAVIVSQALVDKLPTDSGFDVIMVDGPDARFEQLLESESADDPRVTVDHDAPAMLIYTSGTTGFPKGVTLSHRNVFESASNYLMESFGSEGGVYLACVPYFHVACVPHIATLMRGMQVVVSGFEPRKVVQLIERYGVTHVAMVPTMVSMVLDVLDAEEHDISSIRRVLYAASPMPELTLMRGIARFGPVFEQFYGLTETAGLVTILRPAEHDTDKPGRLRSCGREVNRVDVMLVDGAGLPVEDGQPGEIVVRGANVMRGYWGQPEATADAHFGEWFRTGDAAVRGSDGFLTIVGRLKDMIISGGSNVYPVEVEKVLEDHPSIREVAVVGVPHQVWGESVVAMVVGSEHVDLDDLRTWCRGRLADYKHPRRVCQIDALPRNALGKVDKQALREWAIASPPPGSGSTDA